MGALLLAGIIAVQGQCAPRADMIDLLGEKYEEIVIARGLTGQQFPGMMELLVGPSRSFTVIVTDAASGLACIIAAGENYEQEAEAPPIGDGA